MSIRRISLVSLVCLAAYVGVSSLYTVSEVEQVIITQFGKPVASPLPRPG